MAKAWQARIKMLDGLRLTARAENVLRLNGYDTRAKIAAAHDNDLLRLGNFSKVSLSQVREEMTLWPMSQNADQRFIHYDYT